MAGLILLDTDVLVDYLRNQAEAVAFVNKHQGDLILSSIVVAELYAGVKGEAEMEVLDELVSLYPVVPVTATIAKAAGLLKRDFGRSHGLGLADAIVAASAQAENARLCTLNVRHYPMFPGLRPPYAKR